MVSLITLIDTKLVQGRLQDALGYTLDQMRAAYGNYSACMDLYNLPSSLMVALTASVIPAVSAAVTQRDRRQSARIVRSSLRVTALLAFPMGLGLWALSDPLFRLFYRSYNAELGGSLLAVLGIASIFVCLMLITNSILQAYGRVSVPIVWGLTETRVTPCARRTASFSGSMVSGRPASMVDSAREVKSKLRSSLVSRRSICSAVSVVGVPPPM